MPVLYLQFFYLDSMSWKEPKNQFQASVKSLLNGMLSLVTLFGIGIAGVFFLCWVFGIDIETARSDSDFPLGGLMIMGGLMITILIGGPVSLFNYFWDSDGSRRKKLNEKKIKRKVDEFVLDRDQKLRQARRKYALHMSYSEREIYDKALPWDEDRIKIVEKYGPEPLIQDFGLVKNEASHSRYELWSLEDRNGKRLALDDLNLGVMNELNEKYPDPPAAFIFDPEVES